MNYKLKKNSAGLLLSAALTGCISTTNSPTPVVEVNSTAIGDNNLPFKEVLPTSTMIKYLIKNFEDDIFVLPEDNGEEDFFNVTEHIEKINLGPQPLYSLVYKTTFLRIFKNFCQPEEKDSSVHLGGSYIDKDSQIIGNYEIRYCDNDKTIVELSVQESEKRVSYQDLPPYGNPDFKKECIKIDDIVPNESINALPSAIKNYMKQVSDLLSNNFDYGWDCNTKKFNPDEQKEFDSIVFIVYENLNN